jgi:hypothetical protein
MIVSIDSSRLVHLLVLLGSSYAGGKLILWCFNDWSYTAAFGLAVTVVCQVNNAVLLLAMPPTATATPATPLLAQRDDQDRKSR